MNARVIIRPAVKEDLGAISRLRIESILNFGQAAYSQQQLQQWAAVRSDERTRERTTDGCVLVGTSHGDIVATNSLDLGAVEMVGLFVGSEFQGRGLGRRLVVEIERLAVCFGITKLRINAAMPSVSFCQSCHYQARAGAVINKDPRTGLDCLSMTRSFPQRTTRFARRIAQLLEQLGIAPDYGRQFRQRLKPECRQLATVGNDRYGREQLLHPRAAMAWYELRNSAQNEAIDLQLVSGYRSVDYQASIIERKKQAGQSIDGILKVSAAPGYSEHHSGFALDIASPGSPPLEESFENTMAFEWLTENACDFGFSLSYPRNNRHRITYEPWHWKYHP